MTVSTVDREQISEQEFVFPTMTPSEFKIIFTHLRPKTDPIIQYKTVSQCHAQNTTPTIPPAPNICF